jgi:hypothetical protein
MRRKPSGDLLPIQRDVRGGCEQNQKRTELPRDSSRKTIPRPNRGLTDRRGHGGVRTNRLEGPRCVPARSGRSDATNPNG